MGCVPSLHKREISFELPRSPLALRMVSTLQQDETATMFRHDSSSLLQLPIRLREELLTLRDRILVAIVRITATLQHVRERLY